MTSQTVQYQQGFTADDEDHISKLPYDLISNILSRLPTIDAVATCVLSKHWKDLWMSICNIDIDCRQVWACKYKLPNFVSFVDKMFQCAENVTTIYFTNCSSFCADVSVLESFISGFLKYKAKMLNIDPGVKNVVIHGRFLSMESLIELVLVCSTLKLPTESRFPHLKTLRLRNLVISNEVHNSRTLIFTFTVLETLEISCCNFRDVKIVEIYAPVLKTLVSSTVYNLAVGDYEIKVFKARALVRFESSGGDLDNYISIGSNMVSAELRNSTIVHQNRDKLLRSGIRVRNLFRESLSTLVDLKLSSYLAQAVLESKNVCPQSIFNKLERLSLSSRRNDARGSTTALFELLHAAPFLKFLVIKAFSGWDDYNYEAMESIPLCLLSTVQEIEIDIHYSRYRSINVLRLVKFLMQIGGRAELKRFQCVIHGGFSLESELISSLPGVPSHFTLCISGSTMDMIKRFHYRESCWVEDV